MQICFIGEATVEDHSIDDVDALLRREDGLLWVDMHASDPDARRVLSDVFGFHPLAVQSCLERNRVPKMHAYHDHLFTVLHAPEPGKAGHIHYIELDQFIGARYLVTVHGPLNPVVDPLVAQRETGSVRARIDAARFHPSGSFELSYAIVSALARTMESFVERLTETVWQLEQRVTGGGLGDPEAFLEELFSARHGLLAVGTMAAHSREVYGRMSVLGRIVPSESQPFVGDVVDQFGRVHSLAIAQKDYLQGVIDFYRSRTDTKMMIAAERLAVIAVITLPITALASVYGMNIIVNAESDVAHLVAVLVVMATMSLTLLAWAKRHGWW
jgi:Mg2+ and Co2+ transporter CorA